MGDGDATPTVRRRALAEAGLAAAGMAAFALLRSARVAGGMAAAGGLALVAGAFYLSLRSGWSPAMMLGFVPASRRTWFLTIVGVALGVGLGVAFRWVWMPDLFPETLTAFVWTAAAIGAAEEVLYRGYVQGRLTAAANAVPSPLMGEGKGEGDAGMVPRPALPGRDASDGGDLDKAHGRTRPAVARASEVPPCGPAGLSGRETPWFRGLAGMTVAVVLAAGAHTVYKTALFAWPPEGVAVDYTFLVTWTLLGGAAFGLVRAWAGNVWPALAAHVAFDMIAYGDAVRAPWWVWG
ncbi:MAG: CPBP family intramembrane metalloprotease [Planctomycetes bacterium]|nr:CPBP family intramembrane metalloprotease [Planctomycetota bacterium]